MWVVYCVFANRGCGCGCTVVKIVFDGVGVMCTLIIHEGSLLMLGSAIDQVCVN